MVTTGTELFKSNLAVTAVTSGGTDAPAGGSQETWTVSSSAMFGTAVSGVSQFHVADTSTVYSSEIIAVINVSGTTWTVIRGAENTTPIAHVAGFSVYQVTTTGFLNSIAPWATAEAMPGTGEALFLRVATSDTPSALTTETLYLTFWTAATTGTATTVTTATAGTAASGLTYAAIGIYSIDGSGNLTLVASTGDLHATLWISTYTGYTSTLGSSFSRVAGTRYALGILAVGTTPPTILGFAIYPFGRITPVLAAGYNSQTTLPSTIAANAYYGNDTGMQAILSP